MSSIPKYDEVRKALQSDKEVLWKHLNSFGDSVSVLSNLTFIPAMRSSDIVFPFFSEVLQGFGREKSTRRISTRLQSIHESDAPMHYEFH